MKILDQVSKAFKFVCILFAAVMFTSCGIQAIPQAKNATEASFADITSQYKRRADLIPSLVKVVQGYAKQEEATLTGVVEARAKATSMTIDPSKSTPEQLAQFQNAQGSLSQALGRLMMITENYPQLKADQGFRDLQSQLEGTENRITVARNRHIENIKAFNDLITVPPTNFTNMIFYRHEKMPQWSVSEDEAKAIEKAPEINFGN